MDNHSKGQREAPDIGPGDLVDLREACRILGGSKPINPATLYRGVASGAFPKPIKIGPQLSRWLKAELLAVIDARISERDRSAAA